MGEAALGTSKWMLGDLSIWRSGCVSVIDLTVSGGPRLQLSGEGCVCVKETEKYREDPQCEFPIIYLVYIVISNTTLNLGKVKNPFVA